MSMRYMNVDEDDSWSCGNGGPFGDDLGYSHGSSSGRGGGLGGLGSFYRSVSAGFRRGGADEHDEEVGNPYVSVGEEPMNDFRDMPRRGPLSGIGGSVRSVMDTFLQSHEQQAAEASRGSFWGKDSSSSGSSILKSITPSFLQSEADEDSASTCCPNLSWKHRLVGCSVLVALGQLLQFCAYSSVFGVLTGHPGRFALFYSAGNAMMVASSFFLSGPRQQCKKIRAKDRLPTFCAFVLAMLITMKVVLGPAFLGRPVVILVLVVVQWCAQVWYILSYVPYGHTVGRRFLRKITRWICTC